MTDAPAMEETEQLVAQLDQALDEHRLWLQRWHRVVVCGEAADLDLMALKPYLETQFGQFLANRSTGELLSQPAFDELESSFRIMHETARMLLLRQQQGKRIPALEYDAFMEKNDQMVGLLRRMQDAFRKAVSELDPLTGLHNRQIMLRELQTEYTRSVRSGSPCAVVLVDLDHFKNVNDIHGHAAGDKVLRRTAGRFLSLMRPYDLIYRYGGEEFLLLLPNTNTDTAISILERLRCALEARPVTVENGMELRVTASFGLTMMTRDVSLHDTLAHADQALYEAKKTGRNRIIIWQGTADEGS